MSNDLLPNYDSSVFAIGKPKYISRSAICYSAILGSAMLKILRSLRAEASRIPSIQLSLSAWLRALFLMHRPLAKNSKRTALHFFVSHVIYTIWEVDTPSRRWYY
jgi:hypothetical protein